jgi:hypothetical protein
MDRLNSVFTTYTKPMKMMVSTGFLGEGQME